MRGLNKYEAPNAHCEKEISMAFTRDFNHTVVERVQRDPQFSRALLEEASALFLNGEPAAARLMLRDLVNATVGFEFLADLTQRSSKSVRRMLSPNGNPGMGNLAAIFNVLRCNLGVSIAVRSVKEEKGSSSG